MLGSALNTPGYKDAMPSISSDGLMLFFNSNRPGGFGSFDLFVSTRASLSDPWGNAVNLGSQVNTLLILLDSFHIQLFDEISKMSDNMTQWHHVSQPSVRDAGSCPHT